MKRPTRLAQGTSRRAEQMRSISTSTAEPRCAFPGMRYALDERHLLFDDVVAPVAAEPRKHDGRWRGRCGTFGHNAGVYAGHFRSPELQARLPQARLPLSRVFPIGRSLTSDITNLLLAPDRLRYEYGIKQSMQNGWPDEEPDNWLRRPDVARPQAKIEAGLNNSLLRIFFT